MARADEATKDGYDIQMQTNHLSHFLLVKEIFPLLEKAAAVCVCELVACLQVVRQYQRLT